MQLNEKQAELDTIGAQFEQLKTDFRYNLGLLEERDAELEKYDASHALLTATLEDRDRQLAEIQKLHAEATSGNSCTKVGPAWHTIHEHFITYLY